MLRALLGRNIGTTKLEQRNNQTLILTCLAPIDSQLEYIYP
jgi:hypothetical protein